MRVRRRKHVCLYRGVAPKAERRNQRLSMDFVHDRLFDGRAFRMLTVIDQWRRESVMIETAARMNGTSVAQALERWVARHGSPTSITVDH